jgi:hypothetical protein
MLPALQKYGHPRRVDITSWQVGINNGLLYSNYIKTIIVIIKSSRATSRVKWLKAKKTTFIGPSPSSSSGY